MLIGAAVRVVFVRSVREIRYFVYRDWVEQDVPLTSVAVGGCCHRHAGLAESTHLSSTLFEFVFLFNGSRSLDQKSFLPCAVACEGQRCSFFVYSPENTCVGHLVVVMLIELVHFLPYFWRQLSPPRHVRVFDVYARITKVFFLALSPLGGCFEYWRAWYFGAWCLSYARKRAINCPEMALSCAYIKYRCTFKCWVFLRTVQSVFCFFFRCCLGVCAKPS